MRLSGLSSMIVQLHSGVWIQLEDYVKIVKLRLDNPYILEIEIEEILRVHFELMAEDERRRSTKEAI